ncbi:MAG: hypothetical protein FJ087_07505 [Deltaproteobacteria bacterium]|nr:hypothetical protein [Deltaproteobacteria bacterium]
MTARLTARGGPAVEARVAGIVADASATLRAALPSSLYRAVLLVGGYGRGEGGVQVVRGEERPANNLDVLVVTSALGTVARGAVKRIADAALGPVAARAGIGIDVGVVPAATVERAPCRVFWYDVRHGHRTLFGDPDWAPSLARFTADAILPSDVRDLLVNRATLLVIDDSVLARGRPEGDVRRQVVRHGIKAVIGAGDALLFFLGGYHWKNAERQRRMRERPGVPSDLAALYDEAMETRFRSDDAPWDARDLAAWVDRLRAAARDAHLAVEARRLEKAGLTWEGYPDVALEAIALEAVRGGPGRWLRAAAAAARSRGLPGRASRAVEAGWRFATARDRMGLALPVVAYGVGDSRFRAIARAAVRARGDSPAALRRGYLGTWGADGDPNFPAAARRLGIDVEDGGGPG